jgi:hypothetical protein
MLDNIFSRTHRTTQETVLFRGIYIQEKGKGYFLGKQKMYLSTSTDKVVALNFCSLDYCDKFEEEYEKIPQGSLMYFYLKAYLILT